MHVCVALRGNLNLTLEDNIDLKCTPILEFNNVDSVPISFIRISIINDYFSA